MSAPQVPDSTPLGPSPAQQPFVPAYVGQSKRESIWRVSDGDIPWPIVDDVVIDDGAPVDNIFSEKQMRLLTEPLYSSWAGPAPGVPFVALANVGLFVIYGAAPMVPDVMLAVGVSQSSDFTIKENLSYFVWRRGKVPDVAIEIVSNREGKEDTDKLNSYANYRIPYYVIFDPENQLGGGVLRTFGLVVNRYVATSADWLDGVGLGLRLWPGTYEGGTATWLRWCDKKGILIPTGAEQAEQDKVRADKEKELAEQEKLRADQEKQRADQEEQRADKQKEEAAKARQRARRLEDKLRALGIDPDANDT